MELKLQPHPKWWFSKGNPLISGKPRLVKYYNLARKHRRDIPPPVWAVTRRNPTTLITILEVFGIPRWRSGLMGFGWEKVVEWVGYPPVISHSNGKSTIWRCISYSKWGFSIAMFVYRRVNPQWSFHLFSLVIFTDYIYHGMNITIV